MTLNTALQFLCLAKIALFSCKSLANNMAKSKFRRATDTKVYYISSTATYQINFEFNSCSCRWYLAYAICAHVVAACKNFDREVSSRMSKGFIYRSRRGPKPRAKPASQYLRQETQKRLLEEIESDGESVPLRLSPSPKRTKEVESNEIELKEDAPKLLFVKARRGRPKLNEAQKAANKAVRLAAKSDEPPKKRGRKPLAKKALVVD